MGIVLAPLRLPGRVMGALDSIASEIIRVREQTAPVVDLLPVTEDIRTQAEPIADLLPAVQGLEESLGTRLDSSTRSSPRWRARIPTSTGQSSAWGATSRRGSNPSARSPQRWRAATPT